MESKQAGFSGTILHRRPCLADISPLAMHIARLPGACCSCGKIVQGGWLMMETMSQTKDV